MTCPDKNLEKMAHLGMMTRGIIHDLNNSLASIMGFASFLSDDLDPKSEQHVFAENIKKAGAQIENLVTQIRALAIEHGDEKDTLLNLVEEIRRETEKFKLELLSTQKIIFTSDINTAFLTLSVFQFQVMISNLLQNAVQSLEGKEGLVFVHISTPPNLSIDQGDYERMMSLCSPNITEETPFIRIDIKDTGCGMDEITLNLAASPHFTTKSADIAHGLGLTISREIIGYLNGGMTISTTQNEGTCVTVILPVENIAL